MAFSNLAGAAAIFLAAMSGSAAAQGVAGDQTESPVAQSEIDAALSDTSAAEAVDPWEGFNRKMFAVHVFMDHNFLIPTAKAYRATTPPTARRGVRRFLMNIKAPGIFINDLLQGEIGRAGETLSRFFINSTIGAGGFADPAAQIGIARHSEDFGQTLAVWGIDSGPYLFLPMVGPMTTRDGFGKIVQIGMDPLLYVRTPPADIARYSRAGVGGVSAREQFLDPLADIEAKSLDYYASFRSFYLQAQQREIANGVVDYSGLPDIGEFEDFDELE